MIDMTEKTTPPISDIFKGANETLIHTYYECENRKKKWNSLESIIRKLNNNPIQNFLGLNAINTENKTRKLIMTVNNSILNEIWIARNSFKHEQKKIPTVNIIQNIKRNLKETITIQYNKHETKQYYSNFSRKLYKRKRLMYNLLTFNFDNNLLTFNF